MPDLANTTYLDALNPEQRRAVEHGVGTDGTIGPPLLVIAGAGSGKTNTLAHRVALSDRCRRRPAPNPADDACGAPPPRWPAASSASRAVCSATGLP